MQWSVVGHQQQKRLFEKLIAEEYFARAYLFSGPSGIGKKLFALDVARAVLGGDGDPQKNPDMLILKPGVSKETGKSTDISVKEAQDMKAWAYQRPLYGSAKVVIIDDADRLGDEAANVLLKVLEEPPSYLSIFLISSVRGAILSTILSRCHEILFAPLDADAMSEALADLHIASEDKKILQAIAAGRPGIARAYSEQGRVPEVVRSLEKLRQLCTTGIAERLVLTKSLADDETLPEMVSWWLAWVHGALATNPSLAGVARGLMELTSATSESKYNHRLALDRFALELGPVAW